MVGLGIAWCCFSDASWRPKQVMTPRGLAISEFNSRVFADSRAGKKQPFGPDRELASGAMCPMTAIAGKGGCFTRRYRGPVIADKLPA